MWESPNVDVEYMIRHVGGEPREDRVEETQVMAGLVSSGREWSKVSKAGERSRSRTIEYRPLDLAEIISHW